MDLLNATESFLDHHQAINNLSKHTAKAYDSDLRDFGAHTGPTCCVSTINQDTVRGYIRHMREDRKLRETTIKRRIACLKLFLRWACHEKLLVSNPFDGLGERIRLPKRLPKALGNGEFRDLKAATTCNFEADSFRELTCKVGTGLLMATGIRVGELVTISVDDLDIAQGTLRIQGKGDRQRVVYVLDSDLIGSIARYLATRSKRGFAIQRLLVSEKDAPVTTDKMRKYIGRTAKASGISRLVTPHMLRHSAATQWLEAGLDIRYVQKLLGHQSISTTEIYTHVTDNSLRGALTRALGVSMNN